MKPLIVVPGGIMPQRDRDTIPALYDFVLELSAHCDVTVLSVSNQAEPSYVSSPFRILNPGRGRYGRRNTALVGRILEMMRAERIRFDLVHSFWLGSPSRVARTLAGFAGTAWVAGVGGQELSAERLAGLGRLSRWREQREIRIALGTADTVTGGSRFLLRQLRAYGVDGHWLPLFPDRERFPPRQRMPGRTAQPFKIVTIADHNAAKDPATLLGVIAELGTRGHAVHLDWIGLELEPGAAARMARELGIEAAVTVHGHVPHDRIAAHLSGADLYLQSSRYESQGVAVCEAAACGVPIVGTEVGVLAEMAPSHALGAPVGDVAGLADLIDELIGDRQRLERLGQSALGWIAEYSVGWSVERAIELYATTRSAQAACR